MSHSYSIRFALDLKDKNITFPENCTEESKIRGRKAKVFHGILSYTPERCANCGVENQSYRIIKNGTKVSRLTLNSHTHHPTYLFLKKQRFYCKSCGTTFIAESEEVDRHCFITKRVKQSIAIEAKDKISEKDLAKRHHVSANTVGRILAQLTGQLKTDYQTLPEHLSFDEFQSAQRAMSFIYIDAKSHQILDILPDRKMDTIRDHFLRFPRAAREGVQSVVIDMNTPYLVLIPQLFPNAKIIIDTFHLVQLLNRSLNQTRIKLMNQFRSSNPEDQKKYRKLKRYWKLVLKKELDLDFTTYTYQRLFKGMKTQAGIIDYLINLGEEFKQTYETHQNLIYAIQTKDYTHFMTGLSSVPKEISSYLKTSIRTLKKYSTYVQNTFRLPYNNGAIEGINNKIKVIKRIAFGYRNFSSFKTRILISCNTVQR